MAVLLLVTLNATAAAAAPPATTNFVGVVLGDDDKPVSVAWLKAVRSARVNMIVVSKNAGTRNSNQISRDARRLGLFVIDLGTRRDPNRVCKAAASWQGKRLCVAIAKTPADVRRLARSNVDIVVVPVSSVVQLRKLRGCRCAKIVAVMSRRTDGLVDVARWQASASLTAGPALDLAARPTKASGGLSSLLHVLQATSKTSIDDAYVPPKPRPQPTPFTPRPDAGASIPATTAPSLLPPLGLTASLSATGATIRWSPAPTYVGPPTYRVYRSGTFVAATPLTQLVVTGLACDTLYIFEVEAQDSLGVSPRAAVQLRTAACVPSAPGTPAPPPTPGLSSPDFVLVSQTGRDSTCRRGPAGPACATFDRAYRLAFPGDTVELAAGTYPGQTVQADPAKLGAPPVVFRPMSGGEVYLDGLMNLASDVEFRDLKFDSAKKRGWIVQDSTPATPGPTRVTFRNVHAALFFIMGNVSQISILGGSYGGFTDTTGGSHSQIKSYNSWDGGYPSNILIDSVRFYSTVSTSPGAHMECLQVIAGSNITLRRSKFAGCGRNGQSTANFAVASDMGPVSGVTVENNYFGSNGSQPAVAWSLATTSSVFRYNSVDGPVVLSNTCAGCNFQFKGNYMLLNSTSSTCKPGVLYSFNVYRSNGAAASCGGTGDHRVSTLDFVSAATYDLRLTPGANAINRGDPAAYPVGDLEGDVRTVGGLPDAGADEAV